MVTGYRSRKAPYHIGKKQEVLWKTGHCGKKLGRHAIKGLRGAGFHDEEYAIRVWKASAGVARVVFFLDQSLVALIVEGVVVHGTREVAGDALVVIAVFELPLRTEMDVGREECEDSEGAEDAKTPRAGRQKNHIRQIHDGYTVGWPGQGRSGRGARARKGG